MVELLLFDVDCLIAPFVGERLEKAKDLAEKVNILYTLAKICDGIGYDNNCFSTEETDDYSLY